MLKLNARFGDWNYYKKFLVLVVPMILQAAVTNFVSLLDNIMVGQVGTAQMSGVSIVNQYIFIFNITIFGAVSGGSIFGAQFFGKSDAEGHKYTMRYRLLLSIILVAAAFAIFLPLQETLIGIFLSANDSPALIEETLNYGIEYLDAVIYSLIPFAIGQVYASAIKECGRTYIPMLASIVAVGVNLVFDYGLIFGRLGMPNLGVAGAAIATVIAKIVEAVIIIVWAHARPQYNPYIPGLYKSFYIPGKLFKEITRKSIPLMLNEFLWAFGTSIVAQCYSIRGLDVVAARNISSTIANMFNAVYVQMGAGIGILLGQLLGASRYEEARVRRGQLTNFTVLIALIAALAQVPLAVFFPGVYNTEAHIKTMATFFIFIQAIATPIYAYANACYFTLRSGGKTGITLFFDIFHTWVIMLPLAYILSYHTNLHIYPLFAIVTLSEAIKVIIGFFLVKTGKWINNIID